MQENLTDEETRSIRDVTLRNYVENIMNGACQQRGSFKKRDKIPLIYRIRKR